jgi:hypothetical protein
MRVLLVNPPIYDFTAFDYWLRPYGLLRAAGRLEHACEISFFDFLVPRRQDAWGRGRFPAEPAAKPHAFRDLARKYRRFGRSRDEFRECLGGGHFDAALIQTGMTYWYLGVEEVIGDLRALAPDAKIVLGGIYASLCGEHAQGLGADLVIHGDNLEPLRRWLPLAERALPYYRSEMGKVTAIKLSDGCPCRCTYCAVPLLYPGWHARPVEECLEEARRLARAGVEHIAFYDDALLFHAEQALIPFLEGVVRERLPLHFYTPNALHVRMLTPEIARLMVRAGCRSFSLGFESASEDWLERTGGKGSPDEFAAAMENLRRAGAESIIAYIILGHPDDDVQAVESSMQLAHRMGARIMLSEFAPVPGTVDGERSRPWADLSEPLSHNKTAFTLRRLGKERVETLKSLCHRLNEAANSA